MPAQPNVLFVFTDQHRAAAMGCSGDPNVETPNMDRLAAEGTRFTNAYANDPVCTPSRGCILTGQYPFTHEAVINELRLPEDTPTIAKEFDEAGYRTGYIGKWHLDGLPRDRWTPPGPRRQGFDDYWAINQSSHDYLDAHYYADDPDPIQIDGYTPENETDLAIDFLGDYKDDPFCLFLAWGPPHMPYPDVPQEYKDRYDPDALELRPNVEPRTSTISPHQMSHPDGSSNQIDQEAIIRETLRDYYAHVTALDDQLGRLLEYLEEAGLSEDTIVVFTSDHGDRLWSHAGLEKGDPREEASNIPFLIRWPDEIPAGEVNDTLLGTVDMAPTLLGLADQAPPEAMEGVDLSDVVRGNDADTPDSLYMLRTANLSSGSEWRAVRSDEFTYAELLDGTPWLLYDNDADPYQRTNRAFDPEYADVRAELSEELDGWQDQLDDPMVSGKEMARELGKLDEFHAAREHYGLD